MLEVPSGLCFAMSQPRWPTLLLPCSIAGWASNIVAKSQSPASCWSISSAWLQIRSAANWSCRKDRFSWQGRPALVCNSVHSMQPWFALPKPMTLNHFDMVTEGSVSCLSSSTSLSLGSRVATRSSVLGPTFRPVLARHCAWTNSWPMSPCQRRGSQHWQTSSYSCLNFINMNIRNSIL